MATDKIAVIGLGYVGLPLSLSFVTGGINVLGLDVDEAKVERINAGKSYIKHIDSEALAEAIQDGQLNASSDFSRVREVSAVVICVPTPLNKNREPDISYILDTGRAIAPYLAKGTLVTLESTTYPGTTDTDLRECLEQGSGMKAGQDFHLAFSPEREDPGNPNSKVKLIPKVVGGYTPECLARAVTLYKHAVDTVVPLESCREAEATKLLENIFRSVNIALVNELKVVFNKMGINVWNVIEAAKTKPFGYMPFYPGPGLGGHCIPIDPFYLTWKAREYNESTRFIELAGEVNSTMPEYVINRVLRTLNSEGKSARGSHILLLGLAYKPNVDDDRESPSYVIMEMLEELGAHVSYHDPHVPRIPVTRKHAAFAGRESQPLDGDYDLMLLVTHHREYTEHDFSGLQVPLVDTRNAVAPGRRPAKYVMA